MTVQLRPHPPSSFSPQAPLSFPHPPPPYPSMQGHRVELDRAVLPLFSGPARSQLLQDPVSRVRALPGDCLSAGGRRAGEDERRLPPPPPPPRCSLLATVMAWVGPVVPCWVRPCALAHRGAPPCASDSPRYCPCSMPLCVLIGCIPLHHHRHHTYALRCPICSSVGGGGGLCDGGHPCVGTTRVRQFVCVYLCAWGFCGGAVCFVVLTALWLAVGVQVTSPILVPSVLAVTNDVGVTAVTYTSMFIPTLIALVRCCHATCSIACARAPSVDRCTCSRGCQSRHRCLAWEATAAGTGPYPHSTAHACSPVCAGRFGPFRLRWPGAHDEGLLAGNV
jgi:hypothetical protein